MLSLNRVDIDIENKLFFKNVSFSLAPGQIVRLVAPNGGGKTTLIESILGLQSLKCGQIKRQFSNDDYGYLPQVASQYPKIFLQLKDVCAETFSFYPKELLVKNWHTSSGGERKKALIAKILSEAKKLIVLDEPFNHLDLASIEQVVDTLEKYSEKGISILYTGHEKYIPGSKDLEVMQWRC